MDLEEFKKHFIKEHLGIKDEFGVIFSFIDFGNVDKWFDSVNSKISIKGLKDFANIFSLKTKIYYGINPKNLNSENFYYLIRKIFGKKNFITKNLQEIKSFSLKENKLIKILKANFDVEISVDSIRMLNHFDTFCLFSGDSDFAYLNQYLKENSKKIIIVKSGYISKTLLDSADLIINAKEIEYYLIYKKQQPTL